MQNNSIFKTGKVIIQKAKTALNLPCCLNCAKTKLKNSFHSKVNKNKWF